jgi:hypothetical protein
MKQDVWVIAVGMLAIGFAAWAVWGNPESAPRVHAAHEIQASPEIKLVSERSPYMRSER